MTPMTDVRKNRARLPPILAAGIGILLSAAMIAAVFAPAFSQTQEDDAQIARSLATMLRAARTIISQSQDRINDPAVGYKGLDGKSVLEQCSKLYQSATQVDPLSIDPKTRHGKLIRLLMDSIVEVMDVQQQTLNRQGVGFKGFIPAVFARLVNEAFGRRAAGMAEIKVTAPLQLIRNTRARPDQWEADVIDGKLLSAQWPKDMPYAATSQTRGKTAYRMAMPEYYGSSCLTCHGSPKGEFDVTGYPKDGAREGDLGGVISITLYR
jgi:hypothetical protein